MRRIGYSVYYCERFVGSPHANDRSGRCGTNLTTFACANIRSYPKCSLSLGRYRPAFDTPSPGLAAVARVKRWSGKAAMSSIGRRAVSLYGVVLKRSPRAREPVSLSAAGYSRVGKRREIYCLFPLPSDLSTATDLNHEEHAQLPPRVLPVRCLAPPPAAIVAGRRSPY
jgi:hypothetical protein